MSWLSDGPEDRDSPTLSGAQKYDEEYGDYEARARPNPKGNRARTKTRPEHADAVTGRVLTVDRGRYLVLVDEGSSHEHEATASRASELRNQAIVTGDRVDLVGDTSGDEGTLARIVRIQPRTTVLRRSADDTDEVERVIVANADQMLIVVAAADPEPRPRLVDRYLVAAYDAGISPILCVTKTDLADPAAFLANFAGLDLETVTSAQGEFPLERLRTILAGHTTVAVGHSGVGKSTLVNALVPDANRATGRVNTVTGRGRHTSSSTISYRLDTGAGGAGAAQAGVGQAGAGHAGAAQAGVGQAGAGLGDSLRHDSEPVEAPASGWIIDTPGVRSFGLGHVNPDNILKSFTDLAEIAENCPRGCTHLPGSPDCSINESIAEGRGGDSGRLRLDSLQRLLTTLAG